MKNLFYLLLICLIIFSCKKDNDNGFTPNVPTSINVLSITINDFPNFNTAGTSWDSLDGPDVYPVLSIGNTVLLNLQDEFVENAISSTQSGETWQFTAVKLEQPTDIYSIRLFDNDEPDNDEFIGGLDFQPWRPVNGNPTNIDLFCGTCTTSWTLTVEYEF